MDFKETLLEKKWVKISKDPKDKTEIELVNPATCFEYLQAKREIPEDYTDVQRNDALVQIIGKFLVSDWKNLKYKNKKVKFTKKNSLELMKNSIYKNMVVGLIFNTNFMGDCDLDLEGIAKN